MIVGTTLLTIIRKDEVSSMQIDTYDDAMSNIQLAGINLDDMVEFLESLIEALKSVDQIKDEFPCGKNLQ